MTNNKGHFQGKSPVFDPTTLSSESMQTWLKNHYAAMEAGANVGQIDRAKASKFRLELARR